MRILAIETSCDETSAAVVEGGKEEGSVKLLSNIVSSSLDLHAKTGGIIPEIAARKQVEFMQPVLKKAIEEANIQVKGGTSGRASRQRAASYSEGILRASIGGRETSDRTLIPDIDAIAVTYGPGLIGSLLVGVETAKTLSFVWNKPLIPVNHLFGHIYANWIKTDGTKNISFPALALIVSGAHTDLVLIKKHGDWQFLGGTLDDASGECFDKCARLLGYSYPGGPKISELAKKGNPNTFKLPRPMLGNNNFDFSFSGLKTAFLNVTREHFPILRTEIPNSKAGWQQVVLEKNLNETEKQKLYDLCAALEKAIIDVLVKKTILAAEKYNVKSILLGGGVSANQELRHQLEKMLTSLEMNTKLYAPPINLCTDNAAMIGAAAIFMGEEKSWQEVNANPELYFD